MSSPLFFLTSSSGPPAAIAALSDALYEFCNRIVGHSWLLDNLIALPVNNQLFKAALLGGCFLAAWYGKDEATVRRNRHSLLVTLIASVFVIAVTQTISKRLLLPRPFIQSQQSFHLENDRLVESRPLPYRVPLDSDSQKQYKALLDGEIVQNDLGAFPSDHAGFYVTLAVGVWLVSRSLGWLAIAWTFLVLLGSRIITGQHSPLDVLAGAAIGISILLLLQYLFHRSLRPLLDPIVNWTMRHQTLSTVLIFIVVFEASNTLQDLRPVAEIGSSIVEHAFRDRP
jgi:membrane-associated phospholipid phosphatase